LLDNFDRTDLVRNIMKRRASAIFLDNGERLIVKSDVDIDYPSTVDKLHIEDDFEIYTVDLDDTLFYNEYAMEVFPDYIADICSETGMHPAAVKKMIYAEHYGRLSSGSYMAFDWEDIVYSTARKLKVSKKWDLVKMQEKYYTTQNVFLLWGATEFLKVIEGRAVAATNGFSKYQIKILSKLGILNYFKQVLTPDRVLYTKGDVRFYSAYNNLKRIHIGDDYFFDVEIPAYSGSKTIWIYGSGKLPIGGFEILPSAMVPDIHSAAKLLGYD